MAVVSGGYYAIATLGPEAAAFCAARSDICFNLIHGAETGGSSAGTVVSGGVRVDVARLTYSQTAQGHLAERPYMQSPLLIQQILQSGNPIADPQGAANTFRWDVPGVLGTTQGTWQLVINVRDGIIYHFQFQGG